MTSTPFRCSGPHERVARRIRNLALGMTTEVRVIGRSLWPLVRSGGRLEVERCDAQALHLGDLAVAWVKSRNILVCHMVVGTDPVRTAALLGGEDGEIEVLGKARRFSSQPGRWHRASTFAHALPLLRRAVLQARRSESLRRVKRLAERGLTVRGSEQLRRRWLGPLEVRRIGKEDVEQLVYLVGQSLPNVSSRFLELQLLGAWTRGQGGAVGAWSTRGVLEGFAYLGRYSDEGIPVDGFWIRSVHVALLCRGLGLARRLVSELLEVAREQGLAEVFVDIRADNAHSLALHQRLGFEPVDSSLLPDLAPLSALDGAGAPRVFLHQRL